MVSAKVVATIVGAVCYAGDAAVVHRGGKSLRKEDPPDISKVVLPKIPQPDFLGQDGLPELPPVAVGTFMNTATSTLTAVNGQAAKLQKEMQKVQLESQARIKKEKAGFDKQLKTQEKENLHVQAQNTKLAKSIFTLKEKNQKLLAHAQGLQKDNVIRRTEIQAVGQLLGTTVHFIDEALASTDDSHAEELKVLSEKPTLPASAKAEVEAAEPKTEKTVDTKKVSLSSVKSKASKADDQDDSGDSDDDDDETPSFVQDDAEDNKDDDDADGNDDTDSSGSESSAPPASTERPVENSVALPASDAVPPEPQAPAGLLDVLNQGVNDLKRQGQDSENQLKALFLSSLNTGKQRHTALVAQNQVLTKTLATFQDYQTRLQVADKHLQHTKAVLDKTLAQHSLVLKKLSKLALATPEEAEKVMQSLAKKEESEMSTETKK
eukprot:TRINITY_DN40971_c0_g1_i1.p1 TRINITY_DN40971_c0_g1~~TRINITY_DN40971_c0_g1_i1.p1  ORF type:complete len:436 (-),score=141.45 TRINITY_DN40971_c0_g1_i1:146-1453(-)